MAHSSNLTKEDRQRIVREKALDRIDLLLQHLYEKDLDETALEFFEVVHEFFGDYCGIKYKFTYPELLKFVTKRQLFDEFTRKKMVEFITHLQEKEFSGTEFEKHELESYLKHLRLIIKQSSLTEKPEFPLMRSRWQKLGMRLKWQLAGSGRKFAREDVSRIQLLLGYATMSLNENHIERAKKIYLEMQRIYDRISLQEKKTVYGGIKKLYGEIEDAYANLIQSQMDAVEESVYKALESGNVLIAEKYYKELEELYEDLPTRSKKRIYSEMQITFKKLESEIKRSRITHLNRLLTSAVKNQSMEKLGLARSEYGRAQEIYGELTVADKKRVYNRLLQVYKRLC
jgi:hypothetical protein